MSCQFSYCRSKHIQNYVVSDLVISFWCKQQRDCLELSLHRTRPGWFWWIDQRKVPNLHHAVPPPEYCLVCPALWLDSYSLFCSLVFGHLCGLFFNILQQCCLTELEQEVVTNDTYNETLLCGIFRIPSMYMGTSQLSEEPVPDAYIVRFQWSSTKALYGMCFKQFASYLNEAISITCLIKKGWDLGA